MDIGLDSAISSDPVVRMALWSGLGAALLTLFLIVQIVVLRVLYRRYERRRKAFMAKWSGLLTESSLKGDSPVCLPEIADGEVAFFLAYWNHQYNSLSDEARRRMRFLAWEVKIEQAVRKMLHKGNNAEKQLAIIGIGFFGSRKDIPALKKILISDRPADCLHAAGSMLRIDAEALSEVFPIIARRSDIPTAGIAIALKELEPAHVSSVLADMLKKALDANPRQRVRRRDIVRLIMLTSVAQHSVVRPYLLEILDKTKDDEVITACLRVMRDPLELPRMREFFNHPNWHVRVQVASALGEMGEEKDLKILFKLLSDSQWWVRYRAAQAISALPFVITSHLEGMKKLLGDEFAIDMVDHVIAERAS